VEPPNWWTGSKWGESQVLVYGTNLTGAKVTSKLGVERVTVSANGTYLIAYLKNVLGNPGSFPLTIRTAQGTVIAPFELKEQLPRKDPFPSLNSSDVIYLIMPDRFANGDPSNDDPAISHGLFDPAKSRYYHGGDFKGIRDHLPYFKELGVTAIWLTPWYDNVNHLNEREMPDKVPITDYHGYGAVDFYGVEEHFGTFRELRELVDAAHAMGIKVIQDEVANHTGPYHPWVNNPPTPTWFNGTPAHHIRETWQLWPLLDAGAASDLQNQTLNGWFADILPDLNQSDPDCAIYLMQNTMWWIGTTGIDGVRMDTLPYVPQTFWNAWSDNIAMDYPYLTVIGEVFDADPAITSHFQTDLLTVFDFPEYFKARDVFIRGKSVRELAGMRAHDGLYKHADRLGTFIGNHDVARFMNEEGATADKLKLAFTWLLTSRGIPTIYYGDEIGMRGGGDPDNRRDFPQAAFLKAGRTEEQDSIWEYVHRLLKLRAATPALSNPATWDLCATEQQCVYTRGYDAYIEINNADEAASIACDTGGKQLRTVLGPGKYGDAIPPHSARISVIAGSGNRGAPQ
jgi:glycosidase